MNLDLKVQYKHFYDQMFLALQKGDKASADHFRELMEGVRQESISDRKLPRFNSEGFPDFLDYVLDKNQLDLKIPLKSNCINAAFNFHSNNPVYEPYSPMEFLSQIRSDYHQLKSRDELQVGDLIVLWSKTNGLWNQGPLKVEDLNPQSPDFPFGFVFDHVAVYVGQDCLFHKPDPTLTSRYQINHWDDVVGLSEVVAHLD